VLSHETFDLLNEYGYISLVVLAGDLGSEVSSSSSQ
jgi:hypothetical protein